MPLHICPNCRHSSMIEHPKPSPIEPLPPYERAHLWMWGIIASTVVAIAWAIAWGCTIQAREAIAAGLVEQRVPVTNGTESRWVKP